jgi:hypothetical protein
MSFRNIGISRRADCTVCGSVFPDDSRTGST